MKIYVILTNDDVRLMSSVSKRLSYHSLSVGDIKNDFNIKNKKIYFQNIEGSNNCSFLMHLNR